MGRTNLLSLPEEVLEKILVETCNDHLSDLCASRMACKTLNRVGKRNSFYKEVDLLSSTMPIFNHAEDGIKNFKRSCYAANNPSAIFLCGLSEYFRDHNIEGLAKLKNASEAGHKLAAYIHEMTVLILSADDSGKLHHSPSISSRDCYEMRLLLKNLNQRVYGYEFPNQLKEAILRIGPSDPYGYILESSWCNDCKRHRIGSYWWFYTADTSFLCSTDFWKLEIRYFLHFISNFVKPWDVE